MAMPVPTRPLMSSTLMALVNLNLVNQIHQEFLSHPVHKHWIGVSSVLRPRQHSIGYMGDGFYRSKD